MTFLPIFPLPFLISKAMVSIFLVLQPLPGKSVNHRDNDMFRITRVGVLKLS